MTVSLRIGLVVFSAAEESWNPPDPSDMIWNVCPWRWNGWSPSSSELIVRSMNPAWSLTMDSWLPSPPLLRAWRAVELLENEVLLPRFWSAWIAD